VSETRPLDASLLKRRLLSGGAWATGGKLGAALSGLAANILLTRLLTPQEFGAYLLIVSVASVGALVGCLGLNKTVVRLVAESMGLNQPDRARRTIAMVVGLGLIGALVSSLVYLLAGVPLGRIFEAPALATMAGLIAGWIAVTVLQELSAQVFLGFHDVRSTTIFGSVAVGGSAGLLMRALLLACLAALWFDRGQTNLSTVLLIMIGSGSISVLVSGLLLKVRMSSLPKADGDDDPRVGLKGMLGVSAPFFVNDLAHFVLIYADIWILAAYRSPAEVAVYGAAARFVILVTMPLMIVNSVLPPVIAELYARGERDRLERTVRPVATLAGIPALVTLTTFVVAGGPILGLVYGGFYSGGAAVLALLSLGKLTTVWTGSCGLTLQMTGHQGLMMYISLSTGLLFVLGSLLVVRDYGAVGLAGMGAATLILQNLLMLLFAKKKAGIWTHVELSSVPFRRLYTNLIGQGGDR
jgi:O-antigen/teichoic acid export membrane protein